MFSRVFYEAARDLDSRPHPRTDHVEACRPLGDLSCLILVRRRTRARRPAASSRPAAV